MRRGGGQDGRVNSEYMKAKQIKALLGYTRGYRGALCCAFVLMAAELLLSFVSPLVLSVTIDSVLDSKPVSTAWFFDRFVAAVGGVEKIRASLWIMGAAMIGLKIISGAVGYLRAFFSNYAGERSVNRLRDRFYRHVQSLPFSYHAGVQTGDLIQRATTDIDTIRRFVSGNMLEFVRTILLFVIGILVMGSISVRLTVVALCLAPVIFGVSTGFFNHISKRFQEVEEADGNIFTIIQENLTAARVVRAFGRQRLELEKFSQGNTELRDKMFRLNKLFANLWAALDVISGCQIALVSILGIVYTVRGDITLGQYTAFLSYVGVFLWPIRGFGRILSDFGRTLVAVGRVEQVLAEQPEDMQEDGLTPPLDGDLVFDGVEFGYAGEKVLDGMTMTIKGGTTAAILGGTGSGKSTLVQLIQRLYDADAGTISIGGTDIRDMSKSYLRSRVGIVLQEPFLYSKTVAENIGMKLEHTDMDTVTDAARDACVDGDIQSFEKGYQTVVGERGVTLSGGQKQRVAIARALVGEGDILIFDDSLSAVDSQTDARIRGALRARRRGVTTIIVSHRISTLMEADKIFVLHDGKIAEQGTHQELIAKQGLYRRVYDIQSAQIEQ